MDSFSENSRLLESLSFPQVVYEVRETTYHPSVVNDLESQVVNPLEKSALNKNLNGTEVIRIQLNLVK